MSSYEELFRQHGGPGRTSGATVRVIGWIPYDGVPADLTGRIGGWGGVIQRGDRWRDYVELCEAREVVFYEALREEILRLGLKRGGDWHQNDPEGVPVFSDGSVAQLSFRAWGDLMAALWADHEDRDYGYMDFYMDSCIPADPAG